MRNTALLSGIQNSGAVFFAAAWKQALTQHGKQIHLTGFWQISKCASLCKQVNMGFGHLGAGGRHLFDGDKFPAHPLFCQGDRCGLTQSGH